MLAPKKNLQGLICGEEGQGIIEYTFILILIMFVVIIMLTGFGGTVNSYYSKANSSYPGQTH